MINQITIVGRLTREPEISYTSKGVAYMQTVLAVNRTFKNKEGNIEADFIPCTLWRDVAQRTALYCKKGALLGIEGRIKSTSYENKEGKRVYKTEVLAESIVFLEKRVKTPV